MTVGEGFDTGPQVCEILVLREALSTSSIGPQVSFFGGAGVGRHQCLSIAEMSPSSDNSVQEIVCRFHKIMCRRRIHVFDALFFGKGILSLFAQCRL